MKDKYLSIKSSVSGFSFANLGIFKGFTDGIIGAVLSLVLLDIFNGNSAIVGVYSSIYYAFFMLITLFSGEILKLAGKAKLFYFSMAAIAIIYFMMAFSVAPATFIALDFASAIPQMLVSSLIALFMADFARGPGMERLNARYFFWINVGALIAPVLAMWIAGMFPDVFGNPNYRAPFFAVALFNLAGVLYFRWFKIVQLDKKVKRISAKKTFRQIWRTTIAYFKRRDLVSAYVINFGQYSLQALRILYVPIMVIQNGFSESVLGWVLAAGVLPYVLLSNSLGRVAKKIGIKIPVAFGFLSFAVFAVFASFATGWWLLALFILWQISGAFIEPLTDLFFFNATRGNDRERFLGIFKTVSRLPRFIVPLIASGVILATGATGMVWILAAIIAAAAGVFVLVWGKAK